MNELNLHTLEKHEKEPVQNLIDSAYLYGCEVSRKHKIKWRNSIRTLKKHTKNSIYKPVYFRIVLQHKQGAYFSLHLYRRVENQAESLVGKTTIKDESGKLTNLDLSNLTIGQSRNLLNCQLVTEEYQF